jgi:hypothetical protein
MILRSCDRHVSFSRNKVLTAVTMVTMKSTIFLNGIPGGKGHLARKTENLTAICEPMV